MENNDYNGGLEHFLKEKADQYKLYPSDRVWSAINDKLHPRNKWPYVVVAAIFIGLGIGGNIYDSSIAAGSASKEARRQQIASRNVIPVTGPELVSNNNNDLTEQELPPSSSGRPAPTMRVAFVNREQLRREDRNGQEKQLTALRPEIASITPGLTTDETTEGQEMTTGAASPVETSEVIINDKVRLPETVTADLKALKASKTITTDKKALPKTTAIRVMKPYKQMFGLQFYVTPTISYRKLSGHGIRTYNTFTNSYNYSGDVNSVVDQSPMIGTEAGMALVFSMNKRVRFKTGLQANFSQYEVRAYRYTAELVPMTAAGIGHSQINAVSSYRSERGLSDAKLRNQRVMVAIPVGAELSVYNSRNVQFIISGTIQPTYVLNNQSYMISSDLKNYAQAPALYRNFNMNGALEAFVSIRSGSTKWNIGPQVRYQMLSSYKKAYPIKENLLEYGLKIGVTKTLK